MEKNEDRDLVRSAADVESLDAYRAWERRCVVCVDILRARCQQRPSRTGRINSLIARLVRLEGARDLLRRRFVRAGAGYGETPGFSWVDIDVAFAGRVSTGAIINSRYIDPRNFFDDARDTVIDRVRGDLERHACVKVNTVLNGEFVSGDKVDVKSLATRNRQLFRASDLTEWYDRCVRDAILTNLEEFQERDSGWALSRILNLMVNVNACNPLRAGAGEIPLWIRLKKAVIDVRARDNACFARAVVTALCPVEAHPGRGGGYPDYSELLRFDGIEFPVSLRDIKRFEQLNDISVNVFTTAEKLSRKIVPLRLTSDKRNTHVNLLYLPNTSGDSGHFAWIKNMSRLLRGQLGKNTRARHICDHCLHYFYTSEKLLAHSVDCERMNQCAITLPKIDDRWLFFRDYDGKERLSVVVYADIECVLRREESAMGHQRHEVMSIGYYCCCALDRTLSGYGFRRGEDCVAWFVGELNSLAQRARTLFSANLRMATLTPDEESSFNRATHCHVCRGAFAPEDVRVRDHCHMTGRYRGPAHSNCNLNYKNAYVIPVFFHNLSGYDAHFIIEHVANDFEDAVELLPVNKENYISFTKVDERGGGGRRVKLRFVNSSASDFSAPVSRHWRRISMRVG